MQYCKLGINGKILNIIEVADQDCSDADGNFDNNIGLEFLESVFNSTLFCPILLNSNGNAEIDGKWDEDNNCFISVQPFNSWTFNMTTYEWDPPVAKPTDGTPDNPYSWDESNQEWTQK